ncbi:thioredoxin-like protein [Viridothelium virens]|uniref:Thioredoxin-like protein n=1 Tax=Viridothelium virens TaxID=1048519 RepID=A0A6A6HMA4_VIRVR|nr:thioredoxin-like protein [Viridothelium virens]
MGYDSQISFTLDTICPWTYLAKRRLSTALSQIRSTNPPVNFTLHFSPYQLYPEASKEGEDKYEWYKRSKYHDSEDRMKMYTTLMSAYGAKEGIDFKFGGPVANTLDAHRLIQHFQEKSGPECAEKIVNALYKQYFEEERHPSSEDTLLRAALEAEIDEKEARGFISDENEGLMEVKMLIREQASNGVDAVPYIVVEGKRRDFTLEGAKEVEEYIKILEQVIKESR